MCKASNSVIYLNQEGLNCIFPLYVFKLTSVILPFAGQKTD